MSLLHIQLVFVTNYRRPVSIGSMLTFAEPTTRVVRTEFDAGLVEINGGVNHTQVPSTYSPALAVSVLDERLKSRTGCALRRKFTGVCVRARTRGHLQPRFYFAVTCDGAPLSTIKQYIDGQARPL